MLSLSIPSQGTLNPFRKQNCTKSALQLRRTSTLLLELALSIIVSKVSHHMILSSHCPTNTKATTIISQKAIHTVNLGVASPAEVLVDAALALSDEALDRAGFVIVTEFTIIEEATFIDEVGEVCVEAGI